MVDEARVHARRPRASAGRDGLRGGTLSARQGRPKPAIRATGFISSYATARQFRQKPSSTALIHAHAAVRLMTAPLHRRREDYARARLLAFHKLGLSNNFAPPAGEL